MRAKQILLAALAALTLAGCGGSVTTDGIAKMRAMNFLITPSSVDLFTDFNLIAFNLGTGQGSAYSLQTASFLTIGVRQSGTTTTIASTNLNAGRDNNYTVVSYPNASNVPALITLLDDFTAPASAKFKIRLIHVDRLIGNVDLYVTAPGADLSTATPIASNISFTGATNYIESAGGSAISIRITNTGTTNLVGQEILITPPVGSFRTVVLYNDSGAKTTFFSDQN